ncbi:InlB B-repeat-containing protein, partial [Paenibacillus sepulcri]|nr:InlB B-repeat-containing protein [Paenibacillus sepulcri]
SFEMAGLQPDTAYYFNVIAEDLAGNKSAYKMLRVKTASIPAYTLTYDGNGNTGGAAPSDGSSYEQGMSTTIQGNMGLLFRSGYMFAGWNTAADGSGTPYMPGSQLTFDAADITLYAQWTPNSAA